MDPRYAAAAFERLLDHLRARPELQNIELMDLAGFCRNCLADWYRQAAEAGGEPIDREAARTLVYGEPYAQWKARKQRPLAAGGDGSPPGPGGSGGTTP
jgi:hypothetical protein